MPVYLGEAVAQKKKKDSLRQEIEPIDIRKSYYAKQVKDWTAGRPLEESGLVQLSGERLADIVKMAEPARAYGEIFSERSKEKDVFGREGKGWGFPILNKVRGKVQAHRYEKALRKGDIKVWATPERTQLGHKWSVKDVPSAAVPMEPEYLSTGGSTVGEYARKGWTRSKSDADLFMTVGRSLDSVLSTLIHEGAHMEPLIGKQITHSIDTKSKKELGGWENVSKLKREGKAFFSGHEHGEEMYTRLYNTQSTFAKAIKSKSKEATSVDESGKPIWTGDRKKDREKEKLIEQLKLIKSEAETGESIPQSFKKGLGWL